MRVHNHGPEEGEGLACRESLIGDCLRSQYEREGVRAALERLCEMAERMSLQQRAAETRVERLEEELAAERSRTRRWRLAARIARAELDRKDS